MYKEKIIKLADVCSSILIIFVLVGGLILAGINIGVYMKTSQDTDQKQTEKIKDIENQLDSIYDWLSDNQKDIIQHSSNIDTVMDDLTEVMDALESNNIKRTCGVNFRESCPSVPSAPGGV